MDHFARLVLLSGLQSAPNMALAQSLMPDLEDSPAPGGVRWAGENSTSRKNLCFFLMVCQLALFLSQGPWTHIHESMIIHVCLLGLCLLSCSCRVAAACPMLLNSAGGFKYVQVEFAGCDERLAD
jgi:hypothetical protein